MCIYAIYWLAYISIPNSHSFVLSTLVGWKLYLLTILSVKYDLVLLKNGRNCSTSHLKSNIVYVPIFKLKIPTGFCAMLQPWYSITDLPQCTYPTTVYIPYRGVRYPTAVYATLPQCTLPYPGLCQSWTYCMSLFLEVISHHSVVAKHIARIVLSNVQVRVRI